MIFFLFESELSDAEEMRKLKNEELDRLSNEEYKESSKNAVILILDNVRSLNNVGSAFRTGDAFRIEKIYLCGITGTPPHRDIHKTALGATDSVDWEYCKTTLEAIEQVKANDFETIAIEQAENSTSLEDFKPSNEGKYAFIFGNEVFGVEQEVINSCQQCLEIPQFGTKHSLNISVSIGVVLWQYMSAAKF